VQGPAIECDHITKSEFAYCTVNVYTLASHSEVQVHEFFPVKPRLNITDNSRTHNTHNPGMCGMDFLKFGSVLVWRKTVGSVLFRFQFGFEKTVGSVFFVDQYGML